MSREINPRDWLDEARQEEAAGRYAEALELRIKFHEQALVHRRALYGVRLSYALAYWMELAQVYPAAGDALRRICARDTAVLVGGAGNRALFHDVIAINRATGDPRATRDLFINLRQSQSELAEQCADLALPAIVDVEDFSLARELIPQPAERVRELAAALNRDIAELANVASRPELRLDAYKHNYLEAVSMIISVLHGVGDSEAASACRRLAAELVDSSPVREFVCASLQ